MKIKDTDLVVGIKLRVCIPFDRPGVLDTKTIETLISYMEGADFNFGPFLSTVIFAELEEIEWKDAE